MSSLSEAPSNLNDIGPIVSVKTLHSLQPVKAQTPSLMLISLQQIFRLILLPPRSLIRMQIFVSVSELLVVVEAFCFELMYR